MNLLSETGPCQTVGHTHTGVYLSSSWLLWGGVGKDAGTSTVLLVWFNGTRPSPFWVTPVIQRRHEV